MARRRGAAAHESGDDDPSDLGTLGVRPRGLLHPVLAVVLIVVALGLLGTDAVLGANQLAYRAGWSGAPGTVARMHCRMMGTEQDTDNSCTAGFTSQDGRVFLPAARVEGQTTFTHLPYAARLHPDGQTVSIVGAQTVLFALAGMGGLLVPAVLLGGFGVMSLNIGLRRRPRDPILVTYTVQFWIVMAATIAVGVAAVVLYAIGSSLRE
jgi:hypothetical protein